MSDLLQRLRAANPTLSILPVDAPEFERYGRLLFGYDAAEMTARAAAILPPLEAIVYETSVPALEEPSAFNTAIAHLVFGGMPVQVGWCYGKNLRMGALEYHKGVEVVVCLTDLVLLLGDLRDVDFAGEITYDTGNVAAFYAPEGSVVELASWNLHFAPIHVHAEGGFATLVYLPRGTNEPLAYPVTKTGENRLLFAVNKWLMAHPGTEALIEEGAYAGLVGDDVVVVPV